VTRMWGKRNAYRSLVGEPERNSTLVRPRHRWKKIKKYVTEIGRERVNWTALAQDRDNDRNLVNTLINL
jgi:hypothetical protein